MPNDKWATKEYYFEDMLDYLVERHLADVDYNDEDDKEYIKIYI